MGAPEIGVVVPEIVAGVLEIGVGCWRSGWGSGDRGGVLEIGVGCWRLGQGCWMSRLGAADKGECVSSG